jgi:hypothetical protein
MGEHRLTLTVLADHLAVCRLDPRAQSPSWSASRPFFSVTLTEDELSIICGEENAPEGVPCERGWRCLKLEGPFDFDASGILVSVLEPLAKEGVSTLALATYETDYVLVRQSQLEQAISVLSSRGHEVAGRRGEERG